VKAYLDASVLVALFTHDLLTQRAETGLRKAAPVLVVSDFAAAEFASAVARRVRLGELNTKEARSVFSTFDAWTARSTARASTAAAEVAEAEAYLRRLDLPLRTPEALNIALAQGAGAVLATFDDKMAAAARRLGLKILSL
jgi:predicted nucleic acid-binding protein